MKTLILLIALAVGYTASTAAKHAATALKHHNNALAEQVAKAGA